MYDLPLANTNSLACRVRLDAASPQGFPKRHRTGRGALLLAAVALCAGCGSSSSPTSGGGGETVDRGSAFYFGDPNFGGSAQEVGLTSFQYGRLVQLFAFDSMGRRVPMGTDFIVSQSFSGDGVSTELETNPVTGQENLVVLKNVDDPNERAEFLQIVKQAGEALDTIQVQDLSTAGVFSLMPRNAAALLTFDDLLNANNVNERTVSIVTGDPPTLPFNARVFPSTFYGSVVGGTFHPTRVVLDFTISDLEAFDADPPMAINGVGLPASLSVDVANAQLRIPTRTDAAIGVTGVLTNLAGKPLATAGNGPVDFSAPTRPVTRAFRTGGRPDAISDPNNGFLRDVVRPQVVGATPVTLERPQQIGGAGSRLFRVPRMTFASSPCSSLPTSGDVLVQSGVFASIDEAVPAPGGGFELVTVQLLRFPNTWNGPGDWEIFGVGDASFRSAFDGLSDATRPECFVQVSPQPAGFPEEPGTDIQTVSSFTLRFSEPMDPSSLTAFDSLTLTRDRIPSSGSLPTSDYVVGRVSQSADLREVTFDPDQPLAHEAGTAEVYYLTLADRDQPFPPRDLAGNVVEPLPAIDLSVQANLPTLLNGGRVSRFASIDEEPPFGNKPEWTGQFLIDTARQLIRPRPVVRSQVAIDKNQPIVQQMTSFPQGVVTPLSNFGSRMQHVWRYAECGFSLTDLQNVNLDVEGLNWSPAGGSVTPDAFDEFEIRLSHSAFAPDETINPDNAFPLFRNSGIKPQFSNNVLSGATQVVVHPRERGYVLNPAELFSTITGTTVMPFPLNRDVAPDERTYFTWRDTALRSRGGQGGGGVEPVAYLLALGLPVPTLPYFNAGEVQTIGLPLLMEYRTYPDTSAIGQNAWALELALNSSSRPYFRAFTTGGTNQSGSSVFIDPDTETRANGGFNPSTTPPGAPTWGLDNSVHLGAIDFVTRVSRVHSIWYEATIAGESSFTTRRYNPPTLEPAPIDQPDGTSLDVDFRGATALTLLNGCDVPPPDPPLPNSQDNDQDDDGVIDFTVDAFSLDGYGDYYNEAANDCAVLNHDRLRMNPGITFLNGTDEWQDTVDQIESARYYQVRLTFNSNPLNGSIAELSAFALTWDPN
ncbi:MAG: Ig-like domain-containing protein [Planctomycetota bacterium]